METLRTMIARRTLLYCGLGALAFAAMAGCGHKEEATAPLATSRPIDNNSPAAATAPSAPYDSSIVYPGDIKKHGRK